MENWNTSQTSAPIMKRRSAAGLLRPVCMLSSTQPALWHTRRIPSATSKPGFFWRWNSSFITTPIFYVNSAPHLGHLHSALLADVVHRWRKLKDKDGTSILSTGTDEHGLKIQKVAAAMGKEPKALCDEVSNKFKVLFDQANISYTHYIRTTDKCHIQKVQEFWSRLYAGGHIYKGHYEGWYSVADEEYLTSNEVTYGSTPLFKVSKESGHPVEWSSEENYVFRLTAFREQLLNWVKSSPCPIVPEFARDLVLRWLESDCFGDLSVSRPCSRLSWGIPVPGDQSQTIYVWLDALVNYLTVSGHPLPAHTWPPTEHVVGKDILRFHAIYWPAFLLAAGLELPKKIVTHSHWTVGDSKMSKTKGNVVDPLEQFSIFGMEQVRYFLLKEGCLHRDREYSMEKLVDVVNSDLVNTLGNLLLRISSNKLRSTGAGFKYHQDLFPYHVDDLTSGTIASESDRALIKTLHELPGVVDKCYETFHISQGLEAILACLYQSNKFMTRWTPWLLAKDPSQHPTLETVLLIIMESLRLCSSLLLPVFPNHASILLQKLGFPHLPGVGQLACKLTKDGIQELEEASVLMQQYDREIQELPFRKITLPEEMKVSKKEMYQKKKRNVCDILLKYSSSQVPSTK